MIRLFFAIILFFCFVQNSSSQTLVYRPNDKIFDINGKKLSPHEVRKLFAVNEIVSDSYDAGRSKKTIGNILLISGPAIIAGDLARAISTHRPYNPGLTLLGVGCLALAIPIKIGYSKRIEKAVNDFNRLYPNGNTAGLRNTDMAFIANVNGLGFQFTLN